MLKKLVLLLVMPWALFAFNDAPRCLYDLQVHFFPREVARQAFDLFYVFQSQWDPIMTGLTTEARNVPDLMRQKARAMHPNPLEYPFDPNKAKELFLAVEYDVFRRVLVRNYVYNLEVIRGMFDFIVTQQQQRIDACFGKKKAQRGAKKD